MYIHGACLGLARLLSLRPHKASGTLDLELDGLMACVQLPTSWKLRIDNSSEHLNHN